MLFIYLFEGNVGFAKPTTELRKRMVARGDHLLTSTMTLAEVQVGPRRAKEFGLADRYRNVIRQTCEVISFNEAAADLYAKLRENPAIRPADAIQLSCAGAAGVELFITNDKALQRLTVPGIHFITSLDKVPI
jgi:predicted nucleic acid-binding protein